MTYPCPRCGVKKGEPHKPSCVRAQTRRRQGFGRLPRRQQRHYERHACTPRVYKTYKDTEYLRCAVCEKNMGSRKKAT